VHREVTIFAVLVVLIVFFAVKNGEFLTYDNIVTIGQYVAPVAVIGSGEVLLLTLGEIDLSAGQTFLMSAWITLWLQQDGIPIGWPSTSALL
jgi:ribose/xylose/arabinose/galactoside ABC-type transport system permease subunit